MTGSARDLHRTRELKLGEETYNSPHMSKCGRNHSTPRFPEVVDFPRCNSADIDRYMRMPTDTPLVSPQNEMQPEICVEAGTTLVPAFPRRDISFHIEMGRYVWWNNSNTTLVSQIQNAPG